jgi:hypothetical protein
MNTPPIDNITLRDYFAAQAIIGLLYQSQPNVYDLARDAYKLADVMLEERELDPT